MKISIIGAGNVGTHLALGLHHAGHDIIAISSRDPSKAESVAGQVGADLLTEPGSIPIESELVILAVSDDAIEEVSKQLVQLSPDTIVVHTAGSITSTILEGFKKHGVFYPLQTFTRSKAPDWSNIPVLITSDDADVTERLMELASDLTKKVKVISDRDRLVLHLCAAIANNFSNHMFALAEKLAGDRDIDFSLLHPLIAETADKAMTISPQKAQTGPAKRGDKRTMQAHLELLSDEPEIAQLYELISRSIRNL